MLQRILRREEIGPIGVKRLSWLEMVEVDVVGVGWGVPVKAKSAITKV